jgi:LCP family protein required for cell wall assembly
LTTANKKQKKNNFTHTFLPVFIVFLILFTGALFAIVKFGLFGFFGGDSLEDIKAFVGAGSEFAKKYPDSRRINVLVLGENQKLTDTIMLASFDPALKRVDVISVPRDTYYERKDHPGAALQKINSVYKTEGIEGAATAVSNVLCGVPVHFYEIIGDDDVAKIVDAMGGITIDVPMNMKYTDKKQDLYIDLKKGKQTLSGNEAVQYLRYRKGYKTGDIGRVEAQQKFIKAAFKQSIGLGFPKVAKTVSRDVESNLKTGMAAKIASHAVGMTTKDIKTWMTPGAARTENRASYYFVDAGETQKMMDEIYSMKSEEEK